MKQLIEAGYIEDRCYEPYTRKYTKKTDASECNLTKRSPFIVVSIRENIHKPITFNIMINAENGMGLWTEVGFKNLKNSDLKNLKVLENLAIKAWESVA